MSKNNLERKLGLEKPNPEIISVPIRQPVVLSPIPLYVALGMP